MPLQVCETFSSLLGESTLAGLPAFFIRLTGCNLRCHYCDTTYAYEGGAEMTAPELLAAARSHPARRVLVTGGEPLLQADTLPLLSSLADTGPDGALGNQRLLAHQGRRPQGAPHPGREVPRFRHGVP